MIELSLYDETPFDVIQTPRSPSEEKQKGINPHITTRRKGYWHHGNINEGDVSASTINLLGAEIDQQTVIHLLEEQIQMNRAMTLSMRDDPFDFKGREVQ